jgi:hypothetical protein
MSEPVPLLSRTDAIHTLWRRTAELTLLAYVRFGWVIFFILR